MNEKAKNILVVVLLGCLVISVAYFAVAAWRTWHGRIEWSVPEFSVWDSAIGGTELPSPWALNLGEVTETEVTREFYLQNEGSFEFTVTAREFASSGCTGIWLGDPYTLPSDATRILATLTLTISEDTGYYEFDFEVQP